MKNAANLHAVDANNNNNNAEHIATPGVVKTLDSHFHSFGDAVFSFMNSEGFEGRDGKHVNGQMVMAFCRVLQIPFVSGNTRNVTTEEHYFESDAWFFDYIAEKGYTRMGVGSFYLLDEHNRPIAWMDLELDRGSNIIVSYAGAEHVMREFRNIVKENVKVDAAVEKKATFAEVTLVQGMAGPFLHCSMGKIDNARIALPEYYPYLDGGIEALLKEFIESEESVLILMGPPGTGKTSLVAAGIEALDLLPIYAKRADAIAYKDFINYIFNTSDTYMAKIAGTAAKARNDLFKETIARAQEFHHTQPLFENAKEEEAPRVPIIVVEDADLLLAPRSQGNAIMSELLNETDGIGSNHTRKIIFTTNLTNTKGIDEALMRPGRCYDVVNCRLLTANEAIAARRVNGLPDFDVPPTGDISLAEALRKPRKKIVMSAGKASLGFGGGH